VEHYTCGIDIGTSSTKAVVFDPSLRKVFSVSVPYAFTDTREGAAELDPDQVADAVIRCLSRCAAHGAQAGTPLAFASFSSALHTLMAVDRSGNPLGGCLTWADVRPMEAIGTVRSFGNIYERTGCPPHAIYTPAKILWLRRRRPDAYRKAARFVTLKEYILHSLTGRWVADYGVASGGGLLNLHEKDWDRELLRALDLDQDSLSPLADGATVLSMTREWEERIGARFPLVLGSGDGQLANLGAGTYASRRFVATVGTSGAVRVFSPRARLDSRGRTWCYMLDRDTYVTGGAVNNGGIVLSWLRSRLAYEYGEDGVAVPVYEDLSRMAEEVPPGAGGLLFLPFLTGERTPDWNAAARGVILGLGMEHGFRHLVRAAMEGVAFRLNANFLVLQELAGEARDVIISGGVTHSRVWLQILADVLGRPLLLYPGAENSTLGAVLMGLKALGILDDYAQAPLPETAERTVSPDPHNHGIYRELFALFQQAYDGTRAVIESLQDLRGTSPCGPF
jgi:gluconokinase